MLRRQLLVAADAWETVRDVSQRALPREAGGILVGFRMGSDLVINRAVEVSDPDADRHGYVRRQAVAQRALDAVLDGEPRTSLLGWVGDFHSHPADRPASSQDLRSLRRSASADGQALAMLIAVHHRDSWRPFGWVSRGLRTRKARVVITDSPDVSDEGA